MSYELVFAATVLATGFLISAGQFVVRSGEAFYGATWRSRLRGALIALLAFPAAAGLGAALLALLVDGAPKLP